MNKNVYEDIKYDLAEIMIKSTDKNRSSNEYFDRLEESLLSMLIFYCKEVKKKHRLGVIVDVIFMIEDINNIEDFHNLFINIDDETLRSVYTKSYYYATYVEYSEISIGMTKDEANEENGWLQNYFNATLSSLKQRLIDSL